MEDDDEFGDLYTDVLRPLTTSFQTQKDGSDTHAAPSNAASSQSRPIDLNTNSDDEEILYGAHDLRNSIANPGSEFSLNLNEPTQDKKRPEPGGRPELRALDLNLNSNSESGRVEGLDGNGGHSLEFDTRVLGKVEGEKIPRVASGGSNFLEDDDDINIVVEEGDNKDDELVEKDNSLIDSKNDMHSSAAQKESKLNFANGNMVGEISSEQLIPGLSGGLENHGVSNFEDEWESEESEDDLQIVLNDNDHGPMGMEGLAGVDEEEDEDGEPLVIVADDGDVSHHHHQQMMMEEQEWVDEEGRPGADGERKEVGDAAKASGGSTTAPTAVQPKIGYNNHGYHHPFHSQFKYVRPGAAPIPGASTATTGAIPGQVRPPVTIGPAAGRGRGDWRPPGIKGAVPMQKGFHPGYGVPIWGVNAAGRGYGSGLDFTLPSHKTIFEVDIDSFEEKPWKLPGIDVSDFFNFGLNEDSWKDYCRQLEQLRLETTMQSKIRVYESGRAEQDYDPDLPPELAAAVGIQDIPSENVNSGKADAVPTDTARGSARGRPPLPVGRPIPVETGAGDRLPSIDTRRPRMHDTDAIIEIVCHSSTDDDDMAEKQDNDLVQEDLRGDDEIDDLQDEAEHTDQYAQAYDGRKGEAAARKAQLKTSVGTDDIVGEDILHFRPEVQDQPDREIGVSHAERSTRGKGRLISPKMTVSDDKREKMNVDKQHEGTFQGEDGKQSPRPSSDAIGSDEDQAVIVTDDIKDESLTEDRSSDMDREETAVDEIARDTLEDANSMDSTIKQKISSRVEQLSQENDDGKDSKAARSSENSKARSGSSKDQLKFLDNVEDEVLQDRRPTRTGNIKRSGDEDNARKKSRHERAETGKLHMAGKGREDSYSRKGGDTNSPLHRNVQSESADWRKESDVSEGSWHWKDENHHGKRIRVEGRRKREHEGEIGSRNRIKVRDKERSEKDERLQSRNQLDNGNWRGLNPDQDIGSRQRDRDGTLRSQNEKIDDLQSKRRKEVLISREHTEKEDISHSHRETSSRRKRERDDVSDQRRKDERARSKDDDIHFARQKEEGSSQRERNDRQRERDEWHRLKQSREEILLRREREEARPVMRSGRATDNKTWISQSRGKDDHKGSIKEYHPKDVGRHNDQLKRRDRVENENFPQHRVHDDVYARGHQLSNDEKRARYERQERIPHAFDASRVHDHKHKESSRNVKENDSEDQTSLIPSRRNQNEHGGQRTETVKLRGRAEQESVGNEIRQSARKNKEDGSSDDEQSASRRGRSKLERWTSHKERDFSITSMSSSSLKSKDLDTGKSNDASFVDRLPEEPTKILEDKQQPSFDDKDSGAETNNVNAKALEDKHLDTVAKLKKRSERFKLPMPSGKDAVAIKKMESEPLPSAVTETRPDSEIKPERPARKRRWTGN